MDTLECSKCGVVKPEDEFRPYRGKGLAPRRKRRCKQCHSGQQQAWFDAHPGYWKEYRDPAEHRKAQLEYWNRDGKYKRYGITAVQYVEQVHAQESKCAICQDFVDPPHVDHCHETKRVRGLLCGKCNRGLGMFSDSPEKLRAAADYLEKGGVWNGSNLNP